MSRIPMTNGFIRIPEGTHVFRIYSAVYDEEFGKLEIKMVNAKGLTHTERFSLKNADESVNDRAMNAFSFFAKTAMNDFDLEDIDPEELVDHYIEATVVHTPLPSKNDPSKTVTFVNLGEKNPADGFNTEPVARALNLGKPTPVKKADIDLDSLLG